MALLALTYYPDLPMARIRLRNEWFRLDYLGHLGFYAILSVLFMLWRAGWRNRASWKLALVALAGGFLLGAATEATQLLISGRTLNPVDMAYNAAGVVLGVGGWQITGVKSQKIESPT